MPQKHDTVESWLSRAMRSLAEGHELLPADCADEDGKPCYGFTDTHDEDTPHHIITLRDFRDTVPDYPWPDTFNQTWAAIRPKPVPQGQEAVFVNFVGHRATKDDDVLPWALGTFPQAASVYKVENTHPERFGYSGFMSYWIFDAQGNLLSIGHYE